MRKLTFNEFGKASVPANKEESQCRCSSSSSAAGLRCYSDSALMLSVQDVQNPHCPPGSTRQGLSISPSMQFARKDLLRQLEDSTVGTFLRVFPLLASFLCQVLYPDKAGSHSVGMRLALRTSVLCRQLYTTHG